jgi:hypothetical protein
MTEPTPDALQQQIAELERQLAAKRAESGSDATVPYERSEVHAAVGEQIQQAMPPMQTVQPVQSAPSSGDSVPSWQDPALADTVQRLVNVAFTQSVQDAIKQAVASGNAALIDAFHDVLTDQLHQELLNRKKVDAAV